MNLRLTGNLTLVTASTGGIGAAIATSPAREGARVIVNCLNCRYKKSVETTIAAIRAAVPEATLEAEETLRRPPRVDIRVDGGLVRTMV